MSTTIQPASNVVDYSSQTTPAWYACDACRKTGVKLWREPHTQTPMLLCADCLAKEKKVEISEVGMIEHPTAPHVQTFEIDGYLPALASSVPHYFLWSSDPTQDLRIALDWWYSLPAFS